MCYKILTSVLASFLLSGCVYSVHTSKLDKPIKKPVLNEQKETKYYSEISIDSNEKTVSIGDELFNVVRHFEVIDLYEVIPFSSPTSTRFPQKQEWIATHEYNDGVSNDLLVYTTPTYHGSQIGVILDDEYVLSTSEPLVQVSGGKKGRRWELAGQGKFFSIREKTTRIPDEKPWGLRFGGVQSGTYVFEIINRSESTVIEVLQTLKVTEQDFMSGFVVRNVLVKGTRTYNSGVIGFKAKDLKAIEG
ncbi:hypothetical protein NL53_14470 [Vibrio variabilis]|uniref:Lipoprotein n=1 Tax=Vibrio variabilis TaxID=990271 RepID=A0ABR4Y8N8_9VIBR|nr:hypothetical protein [Vibrio variabilis]KHA59829.1 hypothetical protein NL53_14470 [Vibrio variabilis]